MNSGERIAYLRGLLDSMPGGEKENRVYGAILESLDALALELKEQTKLLALQREDCDSLADEIDDLHEALYEVQEALEIDPDSDYEDDEDEDENAELTSESYASATCPSCAYTFYYRHEENREGMQIVCPGCGEEFNQEFDCSF